VSREPQLEPRPQRFLFLLDERLAPRERGRGLRRIPREQLEENDREQAGLGEPATCASVFETSPTAAVPADSSPPMAADAAAAISASE
jgi:hypothetical protein